MFNGSIYVKHESAEIDNQSGCTAKKRAIDQPRRLPPEVLTDDEVGRLMRACSRRAPTGIRNRALIALLYRAGLRINEALSLYPKDLELDQGTVRVLNGKGGKSRTVGIDPGAAAIVELWLDTRSRIHVDSNAQADRPANRTRSTNQDRNARQSVKHQERARRCDPSNDAAVEQSTTDRLIGLREGTALKPPRLALTGRHPVFCTLRGQPLSTAYVRVMLKRLAHKADIAKRVHAHGLRHTHAAQLRTEGVDIAIISRQLGHSRIDVTARYLDHLAPTAVIQTMRQRTWTTT